MLTAYTSPKLEAEQFREMSLVSKEDFAKKSLRLYDKKYHSLRRLLKDRCNFLIFLPSPDVSMDRNAHKEEFSYAYVHAVAAAAGYACEKAPRLLDLDGVDLTVTALGVQGTRRRPRIDLQVKCTSRTNIVHDDYIKFPLEVSAYDNLRFDDPTLPCLLVVVLVPEDIYDWLGHSEDELLIRCCGYWKSLAGESPTLNTNNITIHIPRTNLLTPDFLQGFMRSLGTGGVV